MAAEAVRPLVLTTTVLPLNRSDPGQVALGQLRFMGAVGIRSTEALFGGISALRAGADGQFLAITDTGNWLAFRTIEQGGRLVGVSDGVLAPLLDAKGQPAIDKDAGDAEALEWDPETGEAIVAYEQDHRLVNWKGIDPRRPESLASPAGSTERPPQMRGWPSNGGAEAMAVLRPAGARPALLIVAEDVDTAAGDRQALLIRGGQTISFGISGVPEHRPTEAVALDGTRVLLLQRRFNLRGAGAALSLVDLAPLLADGPAPARVEARLLARWEAPVTLDNMEGAAVVQTGDRQFVYLVSDDNLSSLQQTVLMKFELISSQAAAPRP